MHGTGIKIIEIVVCLCYVGVRNLDCRRMCDRRDWWC